MLFEYLIQLYTYLGHRQEERKFNDFHSYYRLGLGRNSQQKHRHNAQLITNYVTNLFVQVTAVIKLCVQT